MRKYRYRTLVMSVSLLLASMLLCIISCRKETVIAPLELTTITLGVGTQGNILLSTKAEDPNVLPYEGIRTLRVIIVSTADAGNRKILYNEKHIIDNSSAPMSPVLNTTVKIEDVPMGPADIYIIANEESIISGEGYTNEVLEGEVYRQDDKLLVLDESWQFFPKVYEEISENGLPMSGKLENVNIEPNGTVGPVELVRAIVKINLIVENATGGELNLKWVKFGQFISDRVFMFRRDGTSLDIPDDTKYTDKQYGSDDAPLDVTLAQGHKTDWDPVYIFPNFAYRDPSGSNPYTLALATDRKNYEASQFASDLNAMVRNTQFNITARITASANIEISYTQVPWERIEIDIPAFD